MSRGDTKGAPGNVTSHPPPGRRALLPVFPVWNLSSVTCRVYFLGIFFFFFPRIKQSGIVSVPPAPPAGRTGVKLFQLQLPSGISAHGATPSAFPAAPGSLLSLEELEEPTPLLSRRGKSIRQQKHPPWSAFPEIPPSHSLRGAALDLPMLHPMTPEAFPT